MTSNQSLPKSTPRISVITPSIRPDGLAVTFETLKGQTFKDFEWLPRLSIPGEKPDLCKQMNAAIRESKGELIVFLQDWILISPAGLQRMWDRYQEDPTACWTAPVGKIDSFTEMNDEDVKWDWRPHWKHRETINFDHWEIDWGSMPGKALEAALLIDNTWFDEQYDSGFGWENVDLAYRLEKKGWKFRVDPDNKAVAFDHDAASPHPFKPTPNDQLWYRQKEVIDLEYGDTEMEGDVPQA